MENKIKYLTYTAGAIEAASNKEMKSWRQEIRERLASKDLAIYDPVEQEALKVGRSSINQCEYIKGLKQGGHWGQFSNEMEKIWWGDVDTKKLDKINLITYLFEKAKVEGNYRTDLCVDAQTQAINEVGNCKKYTDLNIGDKIATYNKKTKTIEFQAIEKIFINNKIKQMFQIHRKNKAFLFSENHNMIYQWHFGVIKEQLMKILFKPGRKINIPHWQPTLEKKDYYLDNEIKLIAWILAEGSIHFSNRKSEYKSFGSCNITIYQNNGKNFIDILNILKILKIEYHIVKGKCNAIKIYSKHIEYIFSLLEIKDKNYKKIIPNKLYKTSLKQRLLFIEEYLKGDGSVRNNERVLYFGNKSKLKNNFIILLLLSGINFNITTNISGFGKKIYRIHLLKSKQSSFICDKKLENYHGDVWCPTVKNGAWIAIRNGVPFITGNCHWGDYEAVVRSDFIIAYLPKDVKTIGTLFEIHAAYLLGIPVFLILPDQTKTAANSTLVDAVLKSGGDVFYNISDTVKSIKEKYNLK